jgi:hypothetical protein
MTRVSNRVRVICVWRGREGGGGEDIYRIWQSIEVVGLRDFGLSLTTVDWHSTSTIGSPVCV